MASVDPLNFFSSLFGTGPDSGVTGGSDMPSFLVTGLNKDANLDWMNNGGITVGSSASDSADIGTGEPGTSSGGDEFDPMKLGKNVGNGEDGDSDSLTKDMMGMARDITGGADPMSFSSSDDSSSTDSSSTDTPA